MLRKVCDVSCLAIEQIMTRSIVNLFAQNNILLVRFHLLYHHALLKCPPSLPIAITQ